MTKDCYFNYNNGLKYYVYFKKKSRRNVYNRRFSMNKKITVITILFLVVTVFLFSGRKEKQDLYLKAMAEKDLNTKMTLLKQYAEMYADKDDKYLRFIYLNLADTTYKLKNYDEAIQYGETALGYAEMDASNKIRLYLSLANAFYVTRKDPDKAFHYADLLIKTCEQIIEQSRKSEQDEDQIEKFVSKYQIYYIAPAYKIQAMILFNKGKDDPGTLKNAALKAVDAYKTHKDENYSSMVFSLAANLYKKNMVDDAFAVIDQVAEDETLDKRYAEFIGSVYYKKGKKDRAIHFWEIAYQANKKVRTAMKIGQLVNKKDLDKGIKYFADAFVLSKLDKGSDAYKYLEQLYFVRKAKDKSPEEKEKEFKEIINAAKARLGIKGETEPLSAQE